MSGKLAIVDLTHGKTAVEAIPERWRRNFIGGRGLNSLLLYKFLKPGVDPLSPENVFIAGAGLLTGMPAPSASRMNFHFKSPESGILGDGNMGGFFGAAMREAGFDHIVFRGRAEKPAYALLDGGRIELRPAGDYWGLDTIEAQMRFRKDLGRCETAVCGVSGERLVRFAAVRSGMKASARCGGGAVMGSKNLKALAAAGSGEVPVSDAAGFTEYVQSLKDYVAGAKVAAVLGKVGTAFLYDTSNAIGAIRTKNSTLTSWVEAFNSKHIEEATRKMTACAGCYIHCRHRNRLKGEGPEYSTTGLLGANCGIEKTEEVVELNNLCNRYGLDTSSAGSIIGWAMELFERGIIDEVRTEEPLKWGDFGRMKELLRQINFREGFGGILGESTHAVRFFGERSRDYLIAVKGLPQSDPHDCRYIKAFALGIAVASRGADHLRNRPTLEIFTNLPSDVKERIYGKGVNRDPTSYEGKAQAVAFSDDIYAAVDSLGVCKFVCHGFNSPHAVDFGRMAALARLGAGLHFDEKGLRAVGSNIIDIERLFNLREGVTRRDDTIPRRYFEEGMTGPVTKGHRIERAKFEAMLDEYYALRGWTKEGTLPPERVQALEGYL